MPKPNKLQTSYVETHLNLTDAELCKVTGLSIKTIQSYRKKFTEVANTPANPLPENPVQANTDAVTVPAQQPSPLKAGDLMSRRAGAVVMTEAAAQLSDEHSKGYRKPPLNSDHIHRIR